METSEFPATGYCASQAALAVGSCSSSLSWVDSQKGMPLYSQVFTFSSYLLLIHLLPAFSSPPAPLSKSFRFTLEEAEGWLVVQGFCPELI